MSRTQSIPSLNERLVKAAIHLLAHGTADDFENLLWQRRFQEVMSRQNSDYPVFSYDYANRHVLYDHVNTHVLKNEAVDYLEFGVSGGDSLRSWIKLNTHPESRFFGFDSFEGLPENWHENAAKGAYSTNGAIPDIQDHRVRFIPGLFQESLPKFMKDFSTRKRTVLHMDADLYSSTFYALSQCDSVIKPETILVFDEFTARGNKDEFAALYDYCRSHYRKWKIVATRDDFVKIAIKIIQ